MVTIFGKQIIFIQAKSMGFIKTSDMYSKEPLMAEAITWLIFIQANMTIFQCLHIQTPALLHGQQLFKLLSKKASSTYWTTQRESRRLADEGFYGLIHSLTNNLKCFCIRELDSHCQDSINVTLFRKKKKKFCNTLFPIVPVEISVIFQVHGQIPDHLYPQIFCLN